MTKSTLSRTQNIRFAGLITVLNGKEPYDWISDRLMADDFIKRTDGDYALTEKGSNELCRLSFLAGLIYEKGDFRPIRTIFNKPYKKLEKKSQ